MEILALHPLPRRSHMASFIKLCLQENIFFPVYFFVKVIISHSPQSALNCVPLFLKKTYLHINFE